MKLEKFTKNKRQKQIVIGSIVGILLLIGSITLYRTFALYKVEQTFDVLNGTVPDFSSGDVTLAITVEGEKADTIPTEKTYAVDVNCDNAIGTWDYEEWGVKVTKLSKSKVKCSLNFRDTVKKLNGAVPKITDDLVAVIVNPQTGEVTKADTNEKWYDYENKEWANAVILTDEGKNKNFQNNDKIEEKYIESYFVWIPKYRYKIFDMGEYSTTQDTIQDKGSTTAIEIRFGIENTTDTKDSCETPMNDDKTQGLSGEKGQCDVGDWMTHPAFISFNVNGFWVGKFETSNDNGLKIIPGVTSYRNIPVSTMYNSSYSYKRDLDSHMMKNTEWGAVAYLTQSIYGRCTQNGDGSTTCTQVAINSNSNYMTGYSGASTAYPNSKTASTTGNNTGIFDMNGGSWEFMASTAYKNDNNTIDFGLGGEITFKDKKYYDIYNYGTDMTHWERRILGDATGEMGPFRANGSWYISSYFGDWAAFVYSNSPWFNRGGVYGSGEFAGIFTFFRTPGDGTAADGFRIVLAP